MEVTGPISTLPGRAQDFPNGQMCDEHPDRPAVARIQGETDSFGCEMNDMCAECLAQHREAIRTADTSGECEWCGKHAEKRFNRRDLEEGMSGRVYQVCQACIKKEQDYWRSQEDMYGDYDDD